MCLYCKFPRGVCDIKCFSNLFEYETFFLEHLGDSVGRTLLRWVMKGPCPGIYALEAPNWPRSGCAPSHRAMGIVPPRIMVHPSTSCSWPAYLSGPAYPPENRLPLHPSPGVAKRQLFAGVRGQSWVCGVLYPPWAQDLSGGLWRQAWEEKGDSWEWFHSPWSSASAECCGV